MSDVGDSELVTAAQHGDVVALGALLGRYRAPMMAVAVSLLGHHPDTEDVVQNACVRAMVHINDIRDPSAVRSWLTAIVANGCRATVRRRRPDTDARPVDERDASVDTAEQLLERSALRDWVQGAVDALPQTLRTVILLRYFSNASSYSTIAELCGVPVGTVRSRLHCARAHLADRLLAAAAGGVTDRIDFASQRLAESAGQAMAEFEATGRAAQLADCFAADVRFTLADGLSHRGRDRYLTLLARDFDDGVRTRPIRVTAGAGVAVVELRLDNPRDQPLHCPPELTQLHLHNGRQIQRIASHYAGGHAAAGERRTPRVQSAIS